MNHMFIRGAPCTPQTTAWTPCSKSCGAGVSTRTTNRNAQCKLVKETRICEVHPCKELTSKVHSLLTTISLQVGNPPGAVKTQVFTSPLLQKGERCNHRGKTSHPVQLSHAGCQSLKWFQPRYCGSCSDGRCCTPHRTHMLPVRFQCKNGKTFRRMVMMIESCKCSLNCSGDDKKDI